MKNFLTAVIILALAQTVWAFSGFQRSLNDRPWAYTLDRDTVRRGEVSQRFELRAGDCGHQPGWSDCREDRERIEQSQRRPYIPLGKTIWVSWSLRLDPQWPDISPVTTTLGQFHHRDSSTPALLFVQRSGLWSLRIESAKSLYPGRDHWPLARVEDLRGRWVDVVVEARFSSGSDGIIRVWIDGEQRVDLRGANTLGKTPLFFKYGIYRSFVSRRESRPPHIAHWDEVRSGRSRSQVDPRVNPGLRPAD